MKDIGDRILLRSRALFAFVFEHRLDLLAQLGRILVPVHRSRMLHGRVEHFFFSARNFQGAILITRIIATIDRFSI
jgi:hypothetical protein